MYVTRPLSLYRNNPESLSVHPEGPNLGYLVVEDEESNIYCCFGLCKDKDLFDLPFPQNKNLTVRYSEGESTTYHRVTFFPVLNKPVSSNQYYAIRPHGKCKGMAYSCSKEEDKIACCFCRCIKDVKSRPFDSRDTYQQFEITNYENACCKVGRFYAKSIAPDAFPPYFLRYRGWQINAKTPRNYELGEALGLNSTLRARLPDFNFPLSEKSSKPVVVGKWYCPFIFIKDGTLMLKDQMANSRFYEMTLEQTWEQIYERDNIDHGSVVVVDAVVQREVVLVGGIEAAWNENNVVDNIIWFKSYGHKGEEVSVGLSSEIVERMTWEEGRGGWVGGNEREVRLNIVEEFKGCAEQWQKLGCYVLVERFVLKRMDESLVMTYDFKHTHQVKSIWE